MSGQCANRESFSGQPCTNTAPRLVPTHGPIGGTLVRQPEGIAGETSAPAGLEPLTGFMCPPEMTVEKAQKLLADGLALEFADDRLQSAQDMVRRALPPTRRKAHQREIREAHAENEPRPTIPNLDGCYVAQVTAEEAKAVILKYEWLGTMGRAVACYGLHTSNGELIGVAVFGWPSAVESRDICGRDNRHLAVCLERGACVHFAPKNAASYLIASAVKRAAQDHGWRIFYAYADPEAGEIGTVYQACNWLYIGQGVGRTPGRLREDWRLPDGRILSSRSLRHRKLKRPEAIALGWEPIYRHPKHKYVHFEGTRQERRELLAALRYPVARYPKRGQQ